MEKEQNPDFEKNTEDEKETEIKSDQDVQSLKEEEKEGVDEKNPEEKIVELEDKLARTFAEMENQRRRFEKEKEEAFEYGGFSFAKEALNLIDNLERSKQILQNDPSLNNSEAQKKMMHLIMEVLPLQKKL